MAIKGAKRDSKSKNLILRVTSINPKKKLLSALEFSGLLGTQAQDGTLELVKSLHQSIRIFYRVVGDDFQIVLQKMTVLGLLKVSCKI